MKYTLRISALLLLAAAVLWPHVSSAEPQDNWVIDNEWETGLLSSQWLHYSGVAVHPSGLVFVCDRSAGGVEVYDAGGLLIQSWASVGAYDLDISTNDIVYVTTGTWVAGYTTNGVLVRAWPLLGDCYGLAVSQNGFVYCADRDRGMVVCYDLEGNFVREWGEYGTLPGQFNWHHDVAVGFDGLVYVADTGNARIQVFDQESKFIRAISSISDPARVAVSPDGLVYGAYMYKQDNTAGVFDSTGRHYTLIDAGPNNSQTRVRVSARAYRTEGLVSPNALPLPILQGASQRIGTTLVDVDFSVLDLDNPTVSVAAVAFLDGETSLASLVPMRTFEEGTGSALGTNVTSGDTHRLTWNTAADWSTNFVNAQIEILANDGRGLMDFHFLTIPATTNSAELTINRSPVNDTDFLDAWVWLVATDDPQVTLTGGEVYGTTSPYAGVPLTFSSGTVTTASGRAYLFDRMNVREATPAEVTLAQGSGVQWTHRNPVGGRPAAVNEYGFDTGASGYWVIPLP